MIEGVKAYIEKYQLLQPSALHLVALSGGADSVCLLLMLKELGYRVHAVHCNFRLRGEESNRDESFCKTLCEEQGIELHLVHFDTRLYAEMHKISIEMAARELRYDYFEQLREAIDADTIVVAHHSDDQVETFLMNVIRGTGLQGLQAIKPRNGRIVRPLLCINRQNIEEYLKSRQQAYVTDSTNLVDDVMRNKLRLKVLPMLEGINPSVRGNILGSIEHVREVSAIVERYVADVMPEIVTYHPNEMVEINMQTLFQSASPEHLLFEILSPYHFPPALIEQIFSNLPAQSGRVWQSSTHTLASDRGCLLLMPTTVEECRELRIPESGTYIYNERAKIRFAVAQRSQDFSLSRNAWCATLDADSVAFPLIVRPAEIGDRFQPFGMRGTKLVSDYLTDRKMNYFERRRQLVVIDGKGCVVWLPGQRTAQSVAITPQTTKILTIELMEN